MYDFAIVALLALATLKLVDFLVDNLPGLERFRSLGTFLVAMGAVWLWGGLGQLCLVGFGWGRSRQNPKFQNPNPK